MTSREVVRCRACGGLHLQIARSEISEDARAHYETCKRCGSSDGFLQSESTNDEVLRALPVCVAPETPREAGIAIGLYSFSDEEVVRRLRALRRKQS